MVARCDVRELKVATYVRAVLVKHLKKRKKHLFIQLVRAAHEFKRCEQVHRAQSNLHRASPVRSTTRGILLAPAFKLRENLRSEPFIIRNSQCAAKRQKMKEAIHFPKD